MDILGSLKKIMQHIMDGGTHKGRFEGAKICAYGCYPVSCNPDNGGNGSASCLTNCYGEVTGSLNTLFLVHVMSTLSRIIWARVRSWYAVKSEARGATTSKLQEQAKSYDNAKYGYN